MEGEGEAVTGTVMAGAASMAGVVKLIDEASRTAYEPQRSELKARGWIAVHDELTKVGHSGADRMEAARGLAGRTATS